MQICSRDGRARVELSLVVAIPISIVFGMLPVRAVWAVDLSYGQMGSYGVGNVKVSVPRTAGGTGSFNALAYYPATSTGSNAPVDHSGGYYPVISFAHGYNSAVATKYLATLAQLASHGYIVIAPQSYELIPDVLQTENLGHDLTSAYNYLASQNNSTGSPFYQSVQTVGYGALGHSMGGAASISEASESGLVKTVATWAAEDMLVPVSAPVQISNVHVPVQLIAGTLDDVVSPATTASIYNNGNAPIALNNLVGGTHGGFYDSGPEWQLNYTRALSIEWLNLYMKGDQSVWRDIWGPEAGADLQVLSSQRSGILLTAESDHGSALAGHAALYSINVQNLGTAATSFSLFTEDNIYSTQLSMLQTPVLGAGQSTTFQVSVNVPYNGADGALDNLLLSARNDTDGATRGFMQLVTSVTPGMPGDANNDSIVDGLDYVNWADHFGQSVTNGHADGDFNRDGIVDGLDYTIWADHFQNELSASSNYATIPEPSSLVLMAAGFPLCALCRRRFRKRGVSQC